MRLFQRTIHVAILSIATMLLCGTISYALDVPSKPLLDKPIVDTSNTLTPDQLNSLTVYINQTRQEKAYQIGILMIPTLGNASLEEYSLLVARKWGIGDKSNNGVLLLIAKDDRKMRIEVGSGIEGDLTDAESSRIIRNVIAPEFKKGNFYEGIRKGVESIKAQIEKTADPNATVTVAKKTGFGDYFFPVLFFGAIAVSWAGSIFARSRSWWAGGVVGAGIGVIVGFIIGWTLISVLITFGLALIGLVFDYFVSRNFYYSSTVGDSPAWWAGGTWMGGSGGSDSGGDFGGGGFSGGGSSGDW